MRIAVFGAAGNVGSRVVAEALSRGHEVTAVARNPAQPHVVAGDVTNVEDVARVSAGHDVVISATRPSPGNEGELVTATKALLTALARTGIRLLVVGGAGSLIVPATGGATVVDDPAFPEDWRPIAQACAEQLAACRAESEVDWTYLSPAALLEPGVRTGNYRLGTDELVVDTDGKSTISMEDLAVVLLDEVEQAKHHQVRFTAGY